MKDEASKVETGKAVKVQDTLSDTDTLRMRLGDLTLMRAQLESQLKGCLTEQERVLNELSMSGAGVGKRT